MPTYLNVAILSAIFLETLIGQTRAAPAIRIGPKIRESQDEVAKDCNNTVTCQTNSDCTCAGKSVCHKNGSSWVGTCGAATYYSQYGYCIKSVHWNGNYLVEYGDLPTR